MARCGPGRRADPQGRQTPPADAPCVSGSMSSSGKIQMPSMWAITFMRSSGPRGCVPEHTSNWDCAAAAASSVRAEIRSATASAWVRSSRPLRNARCPTRPIPRAAPPKPAPPDQTYGRPRDRRDRKFHRPPAGERSPKHGTRTRRGDAPAHHMTVMNCMGPPVDDAALKVPRHEDRVTNARARGPETRRTTPASPSGVARAAMVSRGETGDVTGPSGVRMTAAGSAALDLVPPTFQVQAGLRITALTKVMQQFRSASAGRGAHQSVEFRKQGTHVGHRCPAVAGSCCRVQCHEGFQQLGFHGDREKLGFRLESGRGFGCRDVPAIRRGRSDRLVEGVALDRFPAHFADCLHQVPFGLELRRLAPAMWEDVFLQDRAMKVVGTVAEGDLRHASPIPTQYAVI